MTELDDRALHYLSRNKEIPPTKDILAILAKPGPNQFNAASLEAAARVLTACATVYLDEENRFHPNTIRQYLSGLENGYGCWLESIRDALAKAPFHSERDRALLQGALHMAEQFIYFLHREDRGRG